MDKKEISVFNEQTLDLIADALREHGYIILPDSFNQMLLQDLQHRAQSLTPENWQQAGVGRHEEYQQNKAIRSDIIHWISPDNPIEEAFLICMENLRQGLNQRLFMGLFDYEGHFSIYAKGANYQKHLDALKGRSNRVLSQILYLNTDWQKADAGELILYSEDGAKPLQTTLPELGTLVLFLSDKFPHEVIKARRSRYSLTGWFRVNNSHSRKIDPAI
ncbi:MAG: 2OG-Fe(II) oxygenase [Emcibacter sp.]|nr:2OG-Fe(II) oxygenase [Emcibacter sp.]